MINDFSNIVPCSEHINEPKYRWSWWGAMLLANRLISAIQSGDVAFRKPKNIVNLLEFLLKNKMDMLNYIYNEDVVIGTTPVKDKKGKIKEYKPYKLIWGAGTPKNEVEGLTFITPNENKWRDTAKILLEALGSACTMLSIFTKRPSDEIFNLLIGGKDIPEVKEESRNEMP